MKTFVAIIVSAVLSGATLSVAAADPVDLRDKKGVVDPKDLKKSDPKEGSTKTKEPPPPEKKPDVPPYEVKKSGDTTEHHHTGKE